MSQISGRVALLLRGTLALAVAALVMFGLGTPRASANQSAEPIVGLWQLTETYGPSLGCPTASCVLLYSFESWTSDGLEFDNGTAPVLTGNVCYGTWIKLGPNTYGLTHPLFNYDPSTGIWDGTSSYYDDVVTVSKDGATFTGQQNGAIEVPGPNPYAGGGTSYSGITLAAKKIQVNKSLLP